MKQKKKRRIGFFLLVCRVLHRVGTPYRMVYFSKLASFGSGTYDRMEFNVETDWMPYSTRTRVDLLSCLRIGVIVLEHCRDAYFNMLGSHKQSRNRFVVRGFLIFGLIKKDMPVAIILLYNRDRLLPPPLYCLGTNWLATSWHFCIVSSTLYFRPI